MKHLIPYIVYHLVVVILPCPFQFSCQDGKTSLYSPDIAIARIRESCRKSIKAKVVFCSRVVICQVLVDYLFERHVDYALVILRVYMDLETSEWSKGASLMSMGHPIRIAKATSKHLKTSFVIFLLIRL